VEAEAFSTTVASAKVVSGGWRPDIPKHALHPLAEVQSSIQGVTYIYVLYVMQQRQIEFKMTRHFFFIIAFIVLTMSSCFYRDEKVNKELTVYSYDKFNYALAIKYTTEGRGNIHTFNFSKFEYENADWIYTNKIRGQIHSDSLVFAHYQDEIEYPWRTYKLIMNWVPYEFNGQYKLKISNERPPMIDPKP
jgi:hypothetical protein